ncbi:MAG: FkbM family methyltransferase, partial [Selenomonadaceae bacterium]|nr:FkbM family methyltransferase [Selenomonadaceae bacterium]
LTDDKMWEMSSSRVAVKYIPKARVICLGGGDSEFVYQMFMNHLPELMEVYASLIDEESRRTFCGYWLGRISYQVREFVYSRSAHYLIDGFIPEPGAVVIDGGVFDGGTAKVFTEMGYKVYGFEMDVKNFEISRKVAESKGFVVENFSLGSYRHKMRYNSVGGSGNSWNTGGADITQVVTLDEYVRENNLPRVDFIKLDVEGAELDILKGARTCIARFKPILAISAYHKLDDFWMLMDFIKSIRHDYEFAMRQGAETREEEPSNISEEFEDYLYSLGLEPERRTCGECVLFAR